MEAPFFLTTPRLAFRRWREDDEPLALALWGDPELARYIFREPPTREAVRARLDVEIANEAAHGLSYWPIFLASTGEHVGCCGLRPRAAAADVPELGVHVRPAFWRRGLALEAAAAVIDHAFIRLGVTALFAGHNPSNTASRQMLLKLGFVHTHDELYPPTGLQHPSYVLRR